MQPTPGGEGQRAAIRRPERPNAVLAPQYGLRLFAIERTDPDASCAGRVLTDKREAVARRRQREAGSRNDRHARARVQSGFDHRHDRVATGGPKPAPEGGHEQHG